jgi:uncharacterized protein (TIGR03435 family)
MKHTVFALAAMAVLTVLPSVPAGAQDAAPVASPSPTFDVASVKLNKSGELNRMFRNQPGGRFNAVNVPLKDIIRVAYGLQLFQIVGGPDWIDNDHYDIVAKAAADVPPLGPPGTAPSPMALMLQNLLADRFKLKTHKDTREMPQYALTLARTDGKLGPKLERPATDCAAMRAGGPGARGGTPPGPPPIPKPGERPPCGAFIGPAGMAVGSISMTQFASMLSQLVGRPVVDKTALDGNWSFNLDFAPEFALGAPPPGAPAPQADPNAPSLYTALQEQLGLKLESQRGPADVLVIDSVERPTED